jgi:hypothetical protein
MTVCHCASSSPWWVFCVVGEHGGVATLAHPNMTPFAGRTGIERHGSALNPQPALSLSAAPLRTFGAYCRRRGTTGDHKPVIA